MATPRKKPLPIHVGDHVEGDRSKMGKRIAITGI